MHYNHQPLSSLKPGEPNWPLAHAFDVALLGR